MGGFLSTPQAQIPLSLSTSNIPLYWTISSVINEHALDFWFSDGNPVVDTPRGGTGRNSSSRLIVQEQGFIDVTIWINRAAEAGRGHIVMTFNDEQIVLNASPTSFDVIQRNHPGMNNQYVMPFKLSLPGDGLFTTTFEDTSCAKLRRVRVPRCPPLQVFTGKFGSFPRITSSDVSFLQSMIARDYVPYQNVTRGKSNDEIATLGARLFPWTPYSYELAMAVYDWTTASFTRMVLMKVFEYTGVDQSPYPLDLDSVAQMIWESDWETFTASDQDFMRSFMMRPAKSLSEVTSQLRRVALDLQTFSAVENRLLAAATYSLSRTSVHAAPLLYSGQVDIQQMGMDRFGIEFLEYPGNAGPVGEHMYSPFETAIETFLRPGSVVTTKAVWSFTDKRSEALSYSNGILIIAEPEPKEAVWNAATYITDLSDGPEKTEWVFPPGTKFVVRSISVEGLDGLEDGHEMSVHVIRLQTCTIG